MNKQTNPLFRHAVRDLSVIPLKDAVLPVSVREVFFNFSVYESIKVIEGIPVFLKDHLERLLESADRLDISHSFSPEDISRMIFLLIMTDSVAAATFRVQLIGGMIPMLFIFPQELPVYPNTYYTEGVSVITYEGERIIPEVKSNSLLLNYLAQREAEKKQALEALFIDRNGCAVEGTRSNFFAVSGNSLITPGKGILAGVTRKYILKSAEIMGMEIVYKDPFLEDILNLQFDELFLSSTSMGAMPISRIDTVLLRNDSQTSERSGTNMMVPFPKRQPLVVRGRKEPYPCPLNSFAVLSGMEPLVAPGPGLALGYDTFHFEKCRELHRRVRKLEKDYVNEKRRELNVSLHRVSTE